MPQIDDVKKNLDSDSIKQIVVIATEEFEGLGCYMVKGVSVLGACIHHKISRCDELSEQFIRHRLIDQLALI